MNPTLDNDLQKAIDYITKNNNYDPVFGDAVAAPEPAVPKTPSMPLPPKASKKTAEPIPAPKPVTLAPAPEPATPAPMPEPLPEPLTEVPLPPEMELPSAPEETKEIKEEKTMAEETTEKITPEPLTDLSDMRSVKEAALRDLAPILKNVDMDSSKKFGLYKNIHDELHDNSVIAPAYETAKEIENDKERADALLYLIDSIDNM